MRQSKFRWTKRAHFLTGLASVAVLMACSNASEEVQEGAAAPVVADVEVTLADFYSEPALARTINIGFDGGGCQAPIVLAQLLGYFEDEGLDTAIVNTGSLVESRDSLAAGHIDTASGMLAGWLVPVTQGIEMAFTLGIHTGCASAFVLADSDIEGFEPGQDVAITGAIGGSFHNIGLRWIYAEGYAPEDFTWRDFAGADAVLALQNGDAQIAVISDMIGQAFVDQGILRRVRSLTDEDFIEENCCMLGISTAFLAENPETSRRITRAVNRAAKWLGENVQEGLELMIEHGYMSANTDIDYATAIFSQFVWGVSAEQTSVTLTDTILEYQALGILNSGLNPEDLYAAIWSPQDLSGEPGTSACCSEE